jgi:hypothetical protein
MKDSMIYLLMTMPYPIPNGENLTIDNRLFVYQRNAYTDARKLLYVKDIYLESFLKKPVNINNAGAFFIQDSSFHFSISDYVTGPYSSFAADYSKKNDTLKISNRTLPFAMDSISFNKYRLSINASMYSSNEKFYFGNSFPYIYNYKQKIGTCFDVLQNKENSWFIHDVRGDGEIISVLLQKPKTGFSMVLVDWKIKKIIHEKSIKLPANINEQSIRLINTNTLIGLDKNNVALIQFSLK